MQAFGSYIICSFVVNLFMKAPFFGDIAHFRNLIQLYYTAKPSYLQGFWDFLKAPLKATDYMLYTQSAGLSLLVFL